MGEETEKESLWRSIVESFVNACEFDGFGDVKTVDIGALTNAHRQYEQAKNDE